MTEFWRASAVVGALLVALTLAGCSSGGAARDTADVLPGPVPEGAVFREPPDDAPAAPSFDLELIDGETFDPAGYWSQRPMVLVFFEPWCEPCRQLQPELNQVADEYRDRVVFVGIAGRAGVDDVRAYVSDLDVTYPVGTDEDDTRWLKYAVSEPPLVALISKGGNLLRGWPGGISGPDLREQIDRLAVG